MLTDEVNISKGEKIGDSPLFFTPILKQSINEYELLNETNNSHYYIEIMAQ
jgi:hypothetical protein